MRGARIVAGALILGGGEDFGRVVRRIVHGRDTEREMRERRPVLLGHDVVHALRSVRMDVDEAGQHRAAREVQPLRIRRNLHGAARAHGDDAVVAHDDRAVVDHLTRSFIVTMRAPVSATTPRGLSAARVDAEVRDAPCRARSQRWSPLANSSAISER